MAITAESNGKITALFRKGWSLDLISELGLTYHWSREDARVVVIEHGWSLDWSGRLSQTDLYYEQFGCLPYRGMVATPGIEQMIEQSVDHELLTIRQAGRKAKDAVDRLRFILAERARRDTEQAAHEANLRLQHARELADMHRTMPHGTWGGYLVHKRNGIPMCDPCRVAGDVYREQQSGPPAPCRARGAKITAGSV